MTTPNSAASSKRWVRLFIRSSSSPAGSGSTWTPSPRARPISRRVPIFLVALVAARGVPALLYRGVLGGRRTAVAALLQSTSLPFIVAATAIGRELDLIDAAGSAAMIGAGLLSVLIFPLAGLTLLRGDQSSAPQPGDSEPAPMGAM